MHVAVCIRECVSGVCVGRRGMCVCVCVGGGGCVRLCCVYVSEYWQVKTLTQLQENHACVDTQGVYSV